LRALTAPGIPAAIVFEIAHVPLLTVAVPEFSQALLPVTKPDVLGVKVRSSRKVDQLERVDQGKDK
jgi:hypothetical protein